MAGDFYDKFPDEIVEFDFDASEILIDGDTISAVQVVAISSGLTIQSSTFSGAIVSFKVTGGVPGTLASALAKVTLASGQLRESLLQILIKRLPTS